MQGDSPRVQRTIRRRDELDDEDNDNTTPSPQASATAPFTPVFIPSTTTFLPASTITSPTSTTMPDVITGGPEPPSTDSTQSKKEVKRRKMKLELPTGSYHWLANDDFYKLSTSNQRHCRQSKLKPFDLSLHLLVKLARRNVARFGKGRM